MAKRREASGIFAVGKTGNMSRKPRKIDAAIDMGTPELARKFSIVPTYTSNTDRASRVLDGTEIDSLLLDDRIDPTQHSTLSLLARKLQSYGFTGLKSPDYSSKVFSDPALVSERKAQALRGAVHLIDKMDKHPAIGRYRRKKLVNLVTADAPWGKHQTDELHHCIAALDSIFGLA